VTTRRTLILLRHAEATDSRPGRRDTGRELTELGRLQARGVGKFLRDQDVKVDAVLCSSAVRARQTLDQLGLVPEPSSIQISEDYYNAGADTLLAALRRLPADCAVGLLVGHAPGVPGVALELADREASDPTAMAAIERRFPAAAAAQFEFTGAWADLAEAVLVRLRLPEESEQSTR
jgi:phosphohistidine phosphatase